jgi:hypothetical protein
MFGDHVQLGDGKAVLSIARFLPGEVYVMSQMRLEISAAGSDLENLASVVFRNGVVTVRATQAPFNVDLVGIAACRGSLCKPQRDQQGRYNNQQEYSLHGILEEVSPFGGRIPLGLDCASDFSVDCLRVQGPGGRTQSIQVKQQDNFIRQEVGLSVPNRSHYRSNLRERRTGEQVSIYRSDSS